MQDGLRVPQPDRSRGGREREMGGTCLPPPMSSLHGFSLDFGSGLVLEFAPLTTPPPTTPQSDGGVPVLRGARRSRAVDVVWIFYAAHLVFGELVLIFVKLWGSSVFFVSPHSAPPL